MDLKDKNEIKQIFINLTNTRGLLWPDIVEGILFDKNGFLRTDKIDVRIDENSLVDKLKLNSTEEVVNYILVLDYLVDYLKKEYGLTDIEISTLLKEYLTESNILNFKKLNGRLGSWIIPLDFIIEENPDIFETRLIDIMKWYFNKNSKSWNLKKEVKNNLICFINCLDKSKIKKLLSIEGRISNELWNDFEKELNKFINEKKNSPTSS